MYLKINYTDDCYSEHSEEKYGDWTKTHHYTFENIVEVEKDGYKIIEVDFIPKVGDDLYLAWESYNTGDSFGTEYGCCELIGVYATRKEAKELKTTLEKDYKTNKDESTKVIDPNGIPISTSPWKGYFESLGDVNIEVLKFAGEE